MQIPIWYPCTNQDIRKGGVIYCSFDYPTYYVMYYCTILYLKYLHNVIFLNTYIQYFLNILRPLFIYINIGIFSLALFLDRHMAWQSHNSLIDYYDDAESLSSFFSFSSFLIRWKSSANSSSYFLLSSSSS